MHQTAVFVNASDQAPPRKDMARTGSHPATSKSLGSRSPQPGLQQMSRHEPFVIRQVGRLCQPLTGTRRRRASRRLRIVQPVLAVRLRPMNTISRGRSPAWTFSVSVAFDPLPPTK